MHAPRFLFPFYSVYISSSLYGSTSIYLISLTESLWNHPYRHIQRCISYLSDSTFGKQTMQMLCSLLEPQLACFDTETVKCANLAYKFTLLSCTQRKVISGYKAYSHKEKKFDSVKVTVCSKKCYFDVYIRRLVLSPLSHPQWFH